MLYASGILPVSRRPDGTVVFLIGKDVRDGTWSDFGGKCERGDRGDPMNTAVREFYEETLGCVVGPWCLRKRMTADNCLALKGVTQNGHPYWMYVLEVPYLPNVRTTFAKILAFLRYKNVDLPLIEKTDVTWVELDELAVVPKRHVFDVTVTRHSDALRRAAAEPWGAVCRDMAHAADFTKRY